MIWTYIQQSCGFFEHWDILAWWRHQMETFSALLALCVANSPLTGEFPAHRPVTRSCDLFFELHLINGQVNNGEAGDLRRHRVHYGVTVMMLAFRLANSNTFSNNNPSLEGISRNMTNLCRYYLTIFVIQTYTRTFKEKSSYIDFSQKSDREKKIYWDIHRIKFSTQCLFPITLLETHLRWIHTSPSVAKSFRCNPVKPLVASKA